MYQRKFYESLQVVETIKTWLKLWPLHHEYFEVNFTREEGHTSKMVNQDLV